MRFMDKVLYRISADDNRKRQEALRGSHPGYLTVAEVSAVLSVSEDTVLRQFGALPGVIDLGKGERMHKRRKRLIRIPATTLQRYIADRQVKVRS